MIGNIHLRKLMSQIGDQFEGPGQLAEAAWIDLGGDPGDIPQRAYDCAAEFFRLHQARRSGSITPALAGLINRLESDWF